MEDEAVGGARGAAAPWVWPHLDGAFPQPPSTGQFLVRPGPRLWVFGLGLV